MKKKILAELQKVLQETQEKKLVKQYKCIYAQWESATEEDILLLPIGEMEMLKVTLFTFEAFRYYQYKYSNGTYSESRMNEPFKLSNAILGQPSAIYNIKKPGISDVKKEIVRKVLDQNEKFVIFNNYFGDAWTLNAELEYATEKYYKEVNMRRLYNDPEMMNRIVLGNWRFEEYEEMPKSTYSAIILKLKGNKMMYVGRYNEANGKVDRIEISKNFILFDESDKTVYPKKGLFGWKI